ncbi:MAG: transporter substrate-binding protein [Panacagrimonas sp.]|jgi:iron complex transport system substrate-binding protein|nr:ABC transporter substrate-binding protein [Panacagrimonas sp.]MCC2655742.1 transporter substrate-binding protein [Panacagrimonas sp.]
MRVISHTCSNTEIVCALGCADFLVGVDDDSDFPPEVVTPLPKLGRDLSLDVARVRELAPDLVLTSLTLPGHQKIVDELNASGLRTLVCEPLRLDDVYTDIERIADALGVPERGADLIARMRAAMPPVPVAPDAPRVLLEWWPKPVIAPTRDSWATDLVTLAGGVNPWETLAGKSQPLTDEQVLDARPDVVVMAWCGVPLHNYRADIVRRRPGWDAVPAVRADRIHAVTEAFLGRPGPRLVEGYRALRELIAAAAART